MFSYHCLNPWIFQARLPVAPYGVSRALCPCAVLCPCADTTVASGRVPQVRSGDMQVRRCAPVWSGGGHGRDNAGWEADAPAGRSVGGPALCGCCSPSVAAAIVRPFVGGKMTGP